MNERNDKYKKYPCKLKCLVITVIQSFYRVCFVSSPFCCEWVIFCIAVIGRGGEQISRLQRESGAKIQMAQDSGGSSERVCTISGHRYD
ncbi:hypothetical protein SK128_023222 [Halocaridina rubra]|uniref:K Homology domain-containing protein n=1 Tax=Halocaridina rubra TaxID=373956 RepID=A0AAN8WQ10_HALRR